MNTIEENEP